MFQCWAADLMDRAAPQSGERILDVACGTGVVARQFQRLWLVVRDARHDDVAAREIATRPVLVGHGYWPVVEAWSGRRFGEHFELGPDQLGPVQSRATLRAEVAVECLAGFGDDVAPSLPVALVIGFPRENSSAVISSQRLLRFFAAN